MGRRSRTLEIVAPVFRLPVARETRTYGDLSFEKHLRLLLDAIHTRQEDVHSTTLAMVMKTERLSVG
jgi:hypothetical protein